VHNHITLWHYAIDPLILAVMMGLQKDEARDALVKPAKLVQLLQDMYGMEVVCPWAISSMHSGIKPVLSMTSGPKRSEWIWPAAPRDLWISPLTVAALRSQLGRKR
jgi:hypothetical protein